MKQNEIRRFWCRFFVGSDSVSGPEGEEVICLHSPSMWFVATYLRLDTIASLPAALIGEDLRKPQIHAQFLILLIITSLCHVTTALWRGEKISAFTSVDRSSMFPYLTNHLHRDGRAISDHIPLGQNAWAAATISYKPVLCRIRLCDYIIYHIHRHNMREFWITKYFREGNSSLKFQL